MTAPLWINADDDGQPSYDASLLRQTHALPMLYDGRPLGARQGVRPGGNQLAVSLDGTTITVAPGVALMDPALTSTQGPYWVAITQAQEHELEPADAANSRIDIVVLRVYDHDEDASTERKAVTEYIPGIPDQAPSPPATPSGALLLAEIDVPQEGGGAPAVTDRRVFTAATGGVLLVPSAAARPASPYAGQMIYRLDQNWTEVYDGTAWRVRSVPVVPSESDLATLITNPYAGQLVVTADYGALYQFDGQNWVWQSERQAPLSVASTSDINPLSSNPNSYAPILTAQYTYRDGRAYRVRWGWRPQFSGGTSPYVALTRFQRYTGSLGTVIAFPAGTTCVTTNFGFANGEFYIKRTGPDTTQTIAMAGSFSTSGNPNSVAARAGSDWPSYMEIEPVGPASRYPQAIEIPTS